MPLAEAARRLWKTLRSQPASVTVAAALAIAAGAIIGLRVANSGDDAPSAAPPTVTSPAATATALTSRITAAAAPATSPPSTPSSIPCGPPVPIDQAPSTPIGCPVAATDLTVTAVPADEGFWATTDAQQPVWVALEGSGESPQQITVGQRFTITGATTSGQPTKAQPPPPPPTAPPIHVTAAYDGLTAAG